MRTTQGAKVIYVNIICGICFIIAVIGIQKQTGHRFGKHVIRDDKKSKVARNYAILLWVAVATAFIVNAL